MTPSEASRSDESHRAAVIMAGGSGTRLWPLSRRARPKQLLKLFDGRSLIQEAFDRLRRVLPAERIYVIALAEHLPAIAEQLPDLPPQNLIGEPLARDTANAVALAAAILHQADSDTVMGVFTADHLIRPADRFVEIITRGYEITESMPLSLVTFGVKPDHPHVGMGYLERGTAVAPGVWRVAAYKEKPELCTAQSYLAAGHYFWNSGMFVWRTKTILDELHRYLPETVQAVSKLAQTWHSAAGQEQARQVYPSLTRISIDYAVMEKATNVLMLEMDCRWLDVGHWTSLPLVMGADADGNTVAATNTVTVAARNNILVSETGHLIVAIGADELVVVHSADATLVCRRDQLDRLKEIVAQLERDQGGRFT